MPRRLSITSAFAAGHLQDELVRVADRHDGEPRLAHQAEIRELRLGLDRGQSHKTLDRLDGLDVDRHRLAVLVGRVG